jgi:hypothetical protein
MRVPRRCPPNGIGQHDVQASVPANLRGLGERLKTCRRAHRRAGSDKAVRFDDKNVENANAVRNGPEMDRHVR